MIALWMLYAVIVTGTLFCASFATEHIARALRISTRQIWVAGMAIAVVISSATLASRLGLLKGTDPAGFAAAGSDTELRTAPARTGRLSRDAFETTERLLAHGKAWTGEKIEAGAARIVKETGSWDSILIALWAAATAAGLLLVFASLGKVDRLQRSLVEAEVDGASVLVSHDVGPAVMGTYRYRIVLPRWIEQLSAADRRMIVAHEREHARSKDPALLLFGYLMVALQPWNIFLWLAHSRLRVALEADCDARVLAYESDRHGYARLLVTVSERTLPGLVAVAPFVEPTSHLEERLERITTDMPVFSSLPVAASIALVLFLSIGTFFIRMPGQPVLPNRATSPDDRSRQQPAPLRRGERPMGKDVAPSDQPSVRARERIQGSDTRRRDAANGGVRR